MPHPDTIEYARHGAQRRIEYGYTRSDVREGLRTGEIIE
jgi:hypothetical protein